MGLIAAILLVGAAQDLPEGARNRLIFEKSPYLRQHADNPVDWLPWGDAAFEKAKKEDKPVFLSIGYSACHWCHVMEEESFMDEKVAEALNRDFVAIKVDREERPDVDRVYMSAAQILTGSGGWPLSVWLTPGREPFFAGTYFPPETSDGRPGFRTLLDRIVTVWKERRADLTADAERLTGMIRDADMASVGEPEAALLDAGYGAFEAAYDDEHGGFSFAPKFPRSTIHEFLFRIHRRAGNAKALAMAEHSLRAMRDGGIYDHLGGGFHRYSTDREWHLPHFEKMLYDNALLARAYASAWQATGREEYAQTAREILDYVLRDMTSPEGGFYSAEDADSGHVEGAFYLWTPEQIKAVVFGEEGDALCREFGIVEGGDGVLDPSAPELHRVGMKALFEARAKRPRPLRDEKILADWNGLMIGAMAFAGAALEEPRYVAAAERAADFLLKRMRREDGRWLHRSMDGEAGIDAFLDDYAYLAEGLYLLHQATFRPAYLEAAVRTAEIMIGEFGDPEGGFFQTAKSGERLIARMKEVYDGALPSGNSVAALALLRLADLTSRGDFRKSAEKTLRAFAGTVAKAPQGYPYLLCALDALTAGPREIVLVGDPEAPATREMLRAVRRRFLPDTVVVLVSPGEEERISTLIPMAEGKTMKDGLPTAYVCENRSCKAPVTSLEEFAGLIGK